MTPPHCLDCPCVVWNDEDGEYDLVVVIDGHNHHFGDSCLLPELRPIRAALEFKAWILLAEKPGTSWIDHCRAKENAAAWALWEAGQ